MDESVLRPDIARLESTYRKNVLRGFSQQLNVRVLPCRLTRCAVCSWYISHTLADSSLCGVASLAHHGVRQVHCHDSRGPVASAGAGAERAAQPGLLDVHVFYVIASARRKRLRQTEAGSGPAALG
jgi:hypothetical protein